MSVGGSARRLTCSWRDRGTRQHCNGSSTVSETSRPDRPRPDQALSGSIQPTRPSSEGYPSDPSSPPYVGRKRLACRENAGSAFPPMIPSFPRRSGLRERHLEVSGTETERGFALKRNRGPVASALVRQRCCFASVPKAAPSPSRQSATARRVETSRDGGATQSVRPPEWRRAGVHAYNHVAAAL